MWLLTDSKSEVERKHYARVAVENCRQRPDESAESFKERLEALLLAAESVGVSFGGDDEKARMLLSKLD